MESAIPTCQDWLGLCELRPTIVRFLSRFTRDDTEIEDVTQETLLRAARHRHTLADERRLRGWVLRIALNVLRSRVRHERVVPRAEVEPDVLDKFEGREDIPGDVPEQGWIELWGAVLERLAVFEHLDAALAHLRADERDLLAAWYAAAPGPERAALVCERAPKQVRVRAYRARRRVTRVLLRRLALDGDLSWPPGAWNAPACRIADGRVVERIEFDALVQRVVAARERPPCARSR